MVVPLVGSLVSFAVALLVGGLAIYASARVVADVDAFGRAAGTAVLGALAWALTAWVPLFGPVLALVVWVGVINWRYPGGWVQAALIGGGAWVAAALILLVVDAVVPGPIDAFGVPGV